MHIRGPRIQEGPPITKATTMNVFLLIAAAIILIVVLLRFKCPIGPAILAGGALLWLFEDPTLRALTEAGHDMLTMNRTYDLLFALYFVMCLEIQLRRSGTLKGMVDALNRFFSSTKVVISSMPAFLGLLPSVGGARFSAPIVETACEGMDIKPESRHQLLVPPHLRVRQPHHSRHDPRLRHRSRERRRSRHPSFLDVRRRLRHRLVRHGPPAQV